MEQVNPTTEKEKVEKKEERWTPTHFPNKILGMFPDGWSDLGESGESAHPTRDNYVVFSSHALCNTRTHIGKESGHVFLFCPKCLIEVIK